MDVQVPGGVTQLRYVKPVVPVLLVTIGQQIFKEPHLMQTAHVKAVACWAQAHATVECSLEG